MTTVDSVYDHSRPQQLKYRMVPQDVVYAAASVRAVSSDKMAVKYGEQAVNSPIIGNGGKVRTLIVAKSTGNLQDVSFLYSNLAKSVRVIIGYFF